MKRLKFYYSFCSEREAGERCKNSVKRVVTKEKKTLPKYYAKLEMEKIDAIVFDLHSLL